MIEVFQEPHGNCIKSQTFWKDNTVRITQPWEQASARAEAPIRHILQHSAAALQGKDQAVRHKEKGVQEKELPVAGGAEMPALFHAMGLVSTACPPAAQSRGLVATTSTSWCSHQSSGKGEKTVDPSFVIP